MDMSDPLFFRDIELLLIVFGGIFFGYLGYRLFIFGVMEGKSKFEAETQVVRLVFSGTAPGLFFMFAGAAILVAALMVRATHTDSLVTSQTREALAPKQGVTAKATTGRVAPPIAPAEMLATVGVDSTTTEVVRSTTMSHQTSTTKKH